MREVDIHHRTFQFACRIVKLCRELDQQPGTPRTLANQLLRSGTSVGANVEEAQAAQSRADFRSKMSIASKEARESLYWLRLTRDGKVLPASEVIPAIEHIERIIRILTSIVKSSGE